MRTCPKCKTPTLAHWRDRADMPDVVPPSRCTHCKACGASRGDRATPGPASVDTERAARWRRTGRLLRAPARGLLVARAWRRQPFHLDRVPGLRRRLVRRRRVGGSRQQRVADHLATLWDRCGAGRVPSAGRTPGTRGESSVRSVGDAGTPRAAVAALRDHPMALARAFVLDRGAALPAESVPFSDTAGARNRPSHVRKKTAGRVQMAELRDRWVLQRRFWPALGQDGPGEGCWVKQTERDAWRQHRRAGILREGRGRLWPRPPRAAGAGMHAAGDFRWENRARRAWTRNEPIPRRTRNSRSRRLHGSGRHGARSRGADER